MRQPRRKAPLNSSLKARQAFALEQAIYAAGETPASVADKLGVANSSMSVWLSGKANLTAETIERILSAIGAEAEFTVRVPEFASDLCFSATIS